MLRSHLRIMKVPYRMQAFLRSTFLAFLVIFALGLTACGGGSSKGANAVATITVAPASLSLNFGDVSAVTAVASDKNNATVASAIFTYTSDHPHLVSVANAGGVCAGKWDDLAKPVVCTPATAADCPATNCTANITVSSGGINAT